MEKAIVNTRKNIANCFLIERRIIHPKIGRMSDMQK